MPTSPKRTILARAVKLVGGQKAFVYSADVDEIDLQSWLDGTREVPEDIFQRALEIVLRPYGERAP